MAGLLRRFFGRARSDDPVPIAKATEPVDDTFQLLAEHSTDLILRVGPDIKVRYASPSSKELFGWAPEELIGAGPEDFVPVEDLPMVGEILGRLMSGEIDTATATVRFLRKDGSYTWIEANSRMLRDPVTGKHGDMVVVRDVGVRKAMDDKLNEMAMTDGLTGLANRRAFDEALDREWRRTLRAGGEISLLLLDLDRFKAFNDRYGHHAGDDCLRAVSAAVKASVRRPGDLVARYGGEEIVVILPDTGSAGAVTVGEAIRAAIEGLRLPHAGNPEGGFRVTASVGAATAVARIGGTVSMPQGLLIAADSALYKAKHGGRNAVATALLLAPDGSASGQTAA